MRVVFDSNIFVSALAILRGRSSEAINRTIEGGDVLILSPQLVDEVLSVLASRFGHDREALSRTAVFLAEISITVKPSRRISVLADDLDNRVLECAAAGEADCIVTGDKKMLQMKEFAGIRIMSLKDYLER